MTTKTALAIALFASLGLACSVDAPTRENFDYSFQEEMPPEFVPELGFTYAAYDTEFSVRFGDSDHGTSDVDPAVRSVELVIESVQLRRLGEDGASDTWVTVRDSPMEVDLMELADGGVERLAGGPIDEGRYGAIAIEFSDAFVVHGLGENSRLELPGMALYIEDEFSIESGTRTDLAIRFGALRSLERDGDAWTTVPHVHLDVFEDVE